MRITISLTGVEVDTSNPEVFDVLLFESVPDTATVRISQGGGTTPVKVNKLRALGRALKELLS